MVIIIFILYDSATSEIYTLSLHDALPICRRFPRLPAPVPAKANHNPRRLHSRKTAARDVALPGQEDRKSTRLNSSHVEISYAVFCLKKKKKVYIGSAHVRTPLTSVPRMPS